MKAKKIAARKVGLKILVICGFPGILAATWRLMDQTEIVIWANGTETEISISGKGLVLLLAGLGLLCGYVALLIQKSLKDPPLLIEGFQALPSRPEYLPITLGILQSKNYVWAELQRLEGGYEASGVFMVRGRNSARQQFCDRVLKLGTLKDIEAEQTNYRACVEGFLPMSSGQPIVFRSYKSDAQEQMPAGVLYDFAHLGQNSQVQNLQALYASSQVPDAAVASVLEDSLALLKDSWYENGQGERINLYGRYPRLLNKLDTLTVAIENLAGAAARQECDIELRGMRLKNPVDFIRSTFRQKYDDAHQRSLVHQSIIHGDLHSRNILLEYSGQRGPLIWFIDFSNTGQGPTLRDMGSLEADIKLCILEKGEPASTWGAPTWDAILEAEKRFSPWSNSSATFTPTDADLAFLNDQPAVLRAWRCIAAVRRIAEQFKFSQDWNGYALALFHATLPIVYYRCSQQQKEYALISAAWLCETL